MALEAVAMTVNVDLRMKNEWLAKLLTNHHDLITEYWIQQIRTERIPSYQVVSDELLQGELPLTVDSMIYAFRTGDSEGPRRRSMEAIRRRLQQGFPLHELQMSLHALETAVMRIVDQEEITHEEECEALRSASNMYYLVALIVAEVYDQLRAEQEWRFNVAYELGVALSMSLDLDTVLNTALDKVAEYMHVERVAILIPKPGTRQNHVKAFRGLDRHLVKAAPHICKVLGCPSGDIDAIDMRKAVCAVPDVHANKLLDRWAAELSSHGQRSMVCIPLVAKRRHIGILVIFRSEVHIASEGELDLLLAMASHISNAVHNATLYNEAQGKRELDILLKASKIFASSLHTQDLVEKIARMATEATGADLAIVYTPDRLKGDQCHIASYAGRRRAAGAVQQIMAGSTPDHVKLRYGRLAQKLAHGKPMLISTCAEFSDLTRIIRSEIVIPLMQKGILLGVFSLISLDENAFTKADLALPTALGELAAVAIENARLYEYERRIAETLQRSFLPSTLPAIEGYEAAAFYRPAMTEASVGGDFYDLFPVDGGNMNIIIGDVSGKGLDAAVQTAMGKYMVRAYAVEDPSCSSVLKRFNKAFCRYAPEGVFMTAFHGVLNPDNHVFTYSSAGHNPPLLYTSSSGSVAQVDTGELSLGIMCDVEYTEKQIELQVGDVLLLYTDGATDVKDTEGRLEVEGLQQLLLSYAHASAEEIVRSISDGIDDFSHGRLTDDVALIALKRIAMVGKRI
jgi:GAF domain-containing protein